MRYPRLVLFSFSTLAVSAVLSGCGGTVMMESKSSAPSTGPAPTVLAVGEQVNGVATNRKQEVQFSEAMDSATVNAQSFQITDSSGKTMPGVVSYDSDFNTASFLPNPALQTNTTYTATISTAATSAGGVHLASPYTYTFDTRATTDTSPLVVNSVSPAAGATCVSATTAIVITFDEAPDASMLTTADLAVSGPGGAIPVKISTNVTTTQVVLTPTSPLPTGNISVTVQNVGDLAGAMMAAPYTWSFSTACGGGGGASGNEYLYMTGGVAPGTPEFYAFAIDSSTGKLTPVPGSPFQISTGATPAPCGEGCGLQPLADPLGRFLFYNFSQRPNQEGVGSMKVDPATGALANDGLLLTSDPIILNMSADPQGRFIYGSGFRNTPGPSGSDWIISIAVSSSGQLSLAPGEPFQYPEGNNGGDIPAPAASEKFVFAADPDNVYQGSTLPSRMFTFALDQTTGAMGAVNNILDGINAAQQVITPSGKFLYSERRSILSSGFQGPQELAGFLVNADGSLTPLPQPPIPTPAQPVIITMSPNGNFLYVSGVIFPSTPGGGPYANDIRAYAIDPNTGSLSLTAEYTDNTQAIVPTIDPAVKYVYLSGGKPGSYVVNVYSVNPMNGALTPLTGSQSAIPDLGSMAIVRTQ